MYICTCVYVYMCTYGRPHLCRLYIIKAIYRKIMFFTKTTNHIVFFFFVINITNSWRLCSQTGNSAFMWTTNDGYILALRARLSALELCVRVYEWSLTCRNFLLWSWYLLNSLQILTILLVPKPSSPIENNLLQMWLETDVNSSYIRFLIWVLPLLNEEVTN